ncbi:MAG: hypothetical protein AAFR44_12970, partial [Pseudomonadota bacterium]
MSYNRGVALHRRRCHIWDRGSCSSPRPKGKYTGCSERVESLRQWPKSRSRRQPLNRLRGAQDVEHDTRLEHVEIEPISATVS